MQMYHLKTGKKIIILLFFVAFKSRCINTVAWNSLSIRRRRHELKVLVQPDSNKYFSSYFYSCWMLNDIEILKRSKKLRFLSIAVKVVDLRWILLVLFMQFSLSLWTDFMYYVERSGENKRAKLFRIVTQLIDWTSLRLLASLSRHKFYIENKTSMTKRCNEAMLQAVFPKYLNILTLDQLVQLQKLSLSKVKNSHKREFVVGWFFIRSSPLPNITRTEQITMITFTKKLNKRHEEQRNRHFQSNLSTNQFLS